MVSTVLKPTTPLADKSETQAVDILIDELIAKHRDNSEMMNLMALEATSLATSVESRSKELEGQWLLKRAWNELRGKNQKVAARNDHDLAQGQYLGQQMLNTLADKNLMTYQMVVSLGDKVNRVAADVNDTRRDIAELNQTLATFFSGLRENLEQKFTSLKRNNDLLFWKETIMFDPVYKGKTYSQLERSEKIICLANDFYCRSHQEWNQRDLAFLKSIMVEVGNHPDEKVSLKEVYQNYQENNEVLSQLLKGVDGVTSLSDANEITPTLMAFNKLKSLGNEESHIVDTVIQFAPGSLKNEVSLELTSKLVLNQTSQDLNREISMFDAVMNLVEDLSFYRTLSKAKSDIGQILIDEKKNDDVPESMDPELDNTQSQVDLGEEFMNLRLKLISFSPSDYNSSNSTILSEGIKGILLGGYRSNNVFDDKITVDLGAEEISTEDVISQRVELSSERFSTEAYVYLGDHLSKVLFNTPVYFEGIKITGKESFDCHSIFTFIVIDLNDDMELIGTTGIFSSAFSIAELSEHDRICFV